MKIQINGFDIEVNTEDQSMSIKIIDASGKELSNNTYSQTLEGSEDLTDVEIPEVEDVESTEDSDIENTEETDTETENDTEEIEESFFIPDFEEFKKSRK